jgi:adenylate cyclase class 2
MTKRTLLRHSSLIRISGFVIRILTMPVEIEIKMKVDHLAPVRDRLREIGATRVGEVMETNTFFDTPDRALLASDCGLRLRHTRDYATKHENLIVTYKGPRGEGAVKKREEIEVGVDRADAAEQMMERLGYVRQLSFEKRRETWQLDKCTVELDTLPELGSFVEIECPSETDVMKLREKLGLADVPAVTPTYADLVSHHLSDRGHRETILRFS